MTAKFEFTTLLIQELYIIGYIYFNRSDFTYFIIYLIADMIS